MFELLNQMDIISSGNGSTAALCLDNAEVIRQFPVYVSEYIEYIIGLLTLEVQQKNPTNYE